MLHNLERWPFDMQIINYLWSDYVERGVVEDIN